MSRIILLDTGPLGMVTNPRGEGANKDCSDWVIEMISKDNRVIIPEICDYELRRELIRSGSTRAVDRLDQLKQQLEFLPINSSIMIQAANLWAQARNRGRPTADRHALDGDVILAAQALSIGSQFEKPVIATNNIGHLEQFGLAKSWKNIS